MRRAGAVTAVVVAALALSPSAADAGGERQPVTIQFQSFSPYAVDAVAGDTIAWTNQGGRAHTVTANDGSFNSGNLVVGQTFSRTFTTAGTFIYHCTIHRGMYGEVDVRQVTLDPLPPAAVATNTKVVVSGRTADPTAPVVIQSDTGAGFQPAASASPSADGMWRATLTALKTGRVRAASGAGVSETRSLFVVNRAVQVSLTRRGIAVHVVPAARSALVGLQFLLRDRFGWWRVATARLDSRSNATFRVGPRQSVRARVVLLGKDEWTPLAMSRVLRVHTGK